MKPILFNTKMVQAILEGRKSVTRRVIKPRYKEDEGGFQVCTNKATGKRWVEKSDLEEGSFDNPRYVSPPYQIGDILYVRETFNDIETHSVLYAADKEFIELGCKRVDGYLFMESEIKWKPSIHMKKELARIFLKVTDVRVERLQDIDRLWDNYDKEGMRNPETENISIAMQERFIDVWDSTIKKADIDKYGWESNPFVWVIEFERVEEEQ